MVALPPHVEQDGSHSWHTSSSSAYWPAPQAVTQVVPSRNGKHDAAWQEVQALTPGPVQLWQAALQSMHAVPFEYAVVGQPASHVIPSNWTSNALAHTAHEESE